MLLKCPRCFQDLRIDEAQLPPDKQVWLKCPACGEVFLPVCPDFSASLSETAPGVQRPAPNPRIYELASHLSRAGTYGVDLEALGRCIPVQRTRVPAVFWQAAVGIFAAGAIFLALGFGFAGAEIEAPPPLNPAPLTQAEDPKTSLARDFSAWKEEILSRRTLSKTVAYQGRESQIYKYLIEIMAPESCQELTAVKMWSKRTAGGFRVQGICADPQKTGALLEIEWFHETAVITLAGEKSSLAVPLAAAKGPDGAASP
ncbi:MAG: zinc-ribbon domain-containing protein [Deltaproteobacteria bacterium]|nr:zinc-ribbon domain-containing protein [Deltaproteobacteria bacterium]